MKKRPLIGITMRLELETRRFYLGRDYSEAVEAADGLPMHLSLIPDEAYINAVIDGLDGVLLPGSDTDVDPSLYGEEPHPKLGRVIPDKDETDRLVLKAAERRNIPVFAICYGMQALNVSRGGSLVQDIDSQVDGGIKHEQGKPLERSSHTISVERESILGSLGAISQNGSSVRVNSHHHQAIGKLGEGLKASAWATDGIVECIEDPRKDAFIVGVQWHPELSWRTDSLSRELFEAFVLACDGGKST
jgi:putative glutamine amidotransferase